MHSCRQTDYIRLNTMTPISTFNSRGVNEARTLEAEAMTLEAETRTLEAEARAFADIK